MTLTQQAIAWTLIHFSWQAAAIALVYRIVIWTMARRSSQARYLVSLSALLLMLASALATFSWELRNERPLAPVFSSTFMSAHPATAQAAFPRTTAPGLNASEPVEHPSSANFISARTLFWIDVLWILGVVALSLRCLGGWWIIQRLRTSATEHAPAAVMASFQRISAALDIRRPVLLRISTSITGPMTVGALRAIVLLPLSAVTSLGPEELEVVLAHELAHVRRADFFWNLLQTLAETLFFFHPAVWWINRRIRHERELCCDDLALKVCPNPVVYAHALYRLEQQRSRALHLAMALDGHQSPQTLRMRICRILGEPMTQMNPRPFRPFSLAAACVALVVLALQVPHLLACLDAQQDPSAVPVIAAQASPAPLELHPIVAPDATKIAKISIRPSVQVAVADRTLDLAPVIVAGIQSDDQKPGIHCASQQLHRPDEGCRVRRRSRQIHCHENDERNARVRALHGLCRIWKAQRR